MEVADAGFVRGIRYLEAARRCERWAGDDDTAGKLGRLAAIYRERGYALIGGLEPATGERPIAGSLRTFGLAQHHASGGAGGA
jgi:hypothetical protein